MAFDLNPHANDGRIPKPWPEETVSPLEMFEIVQILKSDWHQIFPMIDDMPSEEAYLDASLAQHPDHNDYGQQTRPKLREFLRRIDHLCEFLAGLQDIMIDDYGDDWLSHHTLQLGMISGDYPDHMYKLLDERGAEELPDTDLLLVNKKEFVAWLKDRMEDVQQEASVTTSRTHQAHQLEKIRGVLKLSPEKPISR